MRALAVGLVTLVVAALAGASPASTAAERPTLVASTEGAVRGFAVGPGKIAWVDARRRLIVLRLASGRRTTVAYTNTSAGPVERDALFGADPGLVFAGSRPLWGDAWTERIPGEPLLHDVYDRLYSTTAAGRLKGIARLHHQEDGGGGPGGWLLSTAGDASGGAYSWTHGTVDDHSFTWRRGGVWTIAGGVSRRVSNLPPASDLARSGSRLALVPLAARSTSGGPEGGYLNPTVVVATVSGRIVARLRPRNSVDAVALTSRYLFVSVADGDTGGSRGVEVRDAATGKLLRWLPGRGPFVAASGRYAVRLRADAVWLMDGATGAVRRLTKVGGQSQVISASIRGRSVWWAVATETPKSRGNTDDAADYVTRFYKYDLRN